MRKYFKTHQKIRALKKEAPILAIELTNRCNAKCVMCWRDEVNRKHEDLDFEKFKEIVLRAGEFGVKVFQLSFFGESTLYQELPESIAFIKEHYPESFVTLNTNAAYLDDQLARKVLNAGISQIKISIDGNNKEEYEEIRKGLKYEVVRENVKHLWNLIQELESGTDVLIQGLHLVDTPIDLSKYEQDWAAYCHKFVVRDEHDLVAKKKEPLLHKVTPCPNLFSQIITMVDGETSICAYDWHGELNGGNILQLSMRKIWRSSLRRRYQLMHMLGLKRLLPVCGDCTYMVFSY